MPDGSTSLADPAYDSETISAQIKAQGGFANMPAKRNHRQRFTFSAFVYRTATPIERFFRKLKQRYDKRATTSSPPSRSSQLTSGSTLAFLWLSVGAHPREIATHAVSGQSTAGLPAHETGADKLVIQRLPHIADEKECQSDD
ncbi:hypothetical protein [Pelagerythrobacter aerophilus]